MDILKYMKKETKKQKEYDRYNVDSRMDCIVDEVKEFEKTCVGKLSKNLNPKGDVVGETKKLVHEIQNYLSDVHLCINGLTAEDLKNGKKILEDSILEWHRSNTYSINSTIFRYRFLDKVITTLSRKDVLSHICEKKRERLSSFKSKLFADNYMYLTGISQNVREFVTDMVEGNPWVNSICIMNQDIAFLKYKKIDPVKYNENVVNLIYDLEQGCYHKFLHPMDMPEDVAIFKLIQLAYLLYSGDCDADAELPTFRDVEGASADDDLNKLVAELGRNIIHFCDMDKRPIMAQAWEAASPYVDSRYTYINENEYLKIGVRALWYVKFFCDNKYVAEFIDRMV